MPAIELTPCLPQKLQCIFWKCRKNLAPASATTLPEWVSGCFDSWCCRPTWECEVFVSPECVARFPFQHGGLGVEGVFARRCVRVRVQNRPQPSPTIRTRSPCLWEILQRWLFLAENKRLPDSILLLERLWLTKCRCACQAVELNMELRRAGA